MKNTILLFSTALIIVSLTAFGLLNSSNTNTCQKETSSTKKGSLDYFLVDNMDNREYPDFIFNVDSRYIATITKKDLDDAKSIIDIFPKKATKSIESFKDSRVSILYNDNKITVKGDSDILNPAQLKLLQSTDYSSDIYISSIYRKNNTATSDLRFDSLGYYITITPEKDAEFTGGYDALIKYLKDNSQEETAITKKDQLKPGRVRFTITKEGNINNVKLSSTSGYNSVDNTLVALITNMSGKWNSAKNFKGEKVDQELVLFFGIQGC